ncbi:hypothetical protein MJG53_018893 [Ovis ammon polii x Ovis aries]|uniref:Uncharacterized protein n=1 Tax=Ovis ammon polii x Ovis aries TaxID=2918886 RepID=A0ACB9U3L0_9CETA|nr:hypothetical protein MJG53_018893 [Ovis ammon polii x Ovis aries]
MSDAFMENQFQMVQIKALDGKREDKKRNLEGIHRALHICKFAFLMNNADSVKYYVFSGKNLPNSSQTRLFPDDNYNTESVSDCKLLEASSLSLFLCNVQFTAVNAKGMHVFVLYIKLLPLYIICSYRNSESATYKIILVKHRKGQNNYCAISSSMSYHRLSNTWFFMYFGLYLDGIRHDHCCLLNSYLS